MTRWPYAVLSSWCCRCRYVAKWVELVEVGGWIGILNININIGVACGTSPCCCCCWLITFTCCRSAGSIATSVCCLCLSLSHVAAAHVRSLRNPTYLPGVFKRSPRQRRRAQAMCAKSEKSTKSQTVKGSNNSNNKLAAATANGQHRWQQQVWLCQAAQPTNSPPSATVAASSSNSSVFPCCSASLPLPPSLALLCFAVFFSPRTAWRMRNVGVIAN